MTLAASTPDDPTLPVSADQLIAGLRQLAERAHEHGIVAFGATITPCEGANYISSEGETIRVAVNEWIRGGGTFDAVIDFDAVVRDPHIRRVSSRHTTVAITFTSMTQASRPWRKVSTSALFRSLIVARA